MAGRTDTASRQTQEGLDMTNLRIDPPTWEWMLSQSKENKKTGCIEWQSGKSAGYGRVNLNNSDDGAHRISYELNVGKIPKGLCVCHHCDNPSCINPDHLWLGTHADNVADMVNKGRGRSPIGENNGRATLTNEQVLQIRCLRDQGASNKELVKKFNSIPQIIERITNRRTWRHI